MSKNDRCRVPAFHGKATEDPDFSWNYFVQHYQDPQQAQQDSKYIEFARATNKRAKRVVLKDLKNCRLDSGCGPRGTAGVRTG